MKTGTLTVTEDGLMFEPGLEVVEYGQVGLAVILGELRRQPGDKRWQRHLPLSLEAVGTVSGGRLFNVTLVKHGTPRRGPRHSLDVEVEGGAGLLLRINTRSQSAVSGKCQVWRGPARMVEIGYGIHGDAARTRYSDCIYECGEGAELLIRVGPDRYRVKIMDGTATTVWRRPR